MNQDTDRRYGLEWFTSGIEGIPTVTPGVIIRDGKRRLILEPSKAMSAVHEKIIDCLRNEMAIVMPNVVCGLRISGNKNAQRHATNKHFFKLDLKDAYGSVRAERLAKMIVERFDDLGTEQEVQEFLEQYCFDSRTGGLAQGLPASNDLFNFYGEVLLDGPIRHEIDMGWSGDMFSAFVQTRYVDDLLFSNYEPIPRALAQRIREVVSRAGFRENHRKTRFHDVTKNGPMIITGRSLDHHGIISLQGKYLRRLEGVLHVATRRPLDCKVSWGELNGHMRYFEHVMRARSFLSSREDRVLKLFAKWAMQQRIDCSDLAEIASKSR